MICIYLYFYVLLLVLSICTKGLRVTQFQFSVCMYGTCGRIDNKADFDFELLMVRLAAGLEHGRIFANVGGRNYLWSRL